jgi:Zn-dependent protease
MRRGGRYHAALPGGAVDAEIIVRGIVWYVVFLFSATAHEAGHAWAAQRGGDLTAYAGGQVSLDPRPHIRREPFGMVLMPILSYLRSFSWMFGWASTPYDPAWALRHPARAAWMSLAGPAANLTIALVAGALIRAGLALGVFEFGLTRGFALHSIVTGEGTAGSVAMILSIAFGLNAVLFFFNLIPIPPLDGGSALGLLLPEDAARRLQLLFRQPAVSIAGMLFAFYFGGQLIMPAVIWSIGLLFS